MPFTKWVSSFEIHNCLVKRSQVRSERQWVQGVARQPRKSGNRKQAPEGSGGTDEKAPGRQRCHHRLLQVKVNHRLVPTNNKHVQLTVFYCSIISVCSTCKKYLFGIQCMVTWASKTGSPFCKMPATVHVSHSYSVTVMASPSRSSRLYKPLGKRKRWIKTVIQHAYLWLTLFYLLSYMLASVRDKRPL